MTEDIKSPESHIPNIDESIKDLAEHPSASVTFNVGDRIRVIELPPYVKTADPMPMLRPPDVIKVGEEGTVLERRAGDYWSVRFARGAFLMEPKFIEHWEDPSSPGEQTHDNEV